MFLYQKSHDHMRCVKLLASFPYFYRVSSLLCAICLGLCVLSFAVRFSLTALQLLATLTLRRLPGLAPKSSENQLNRQIFPTEVGEDILEFPLPGVGNANVARCNDETTICYHNNVCWDIMLTFVSTAPKWPKDGYCEFNSHGFLQIKY